MHLLTPTVRRLISTSCFFLGSVWAAAGSLKLIFGVRITFPLLPPLGLERVSPVSACLLALGFFALAAWLGRGSNERANRSAPTSVDTEATALPQQAGPAPVTGVPPLRTPTSVRRPVA
ncbi:MAG TPA: hypothetical protein VF118_00785 [Gemmatimonadaceae bacterium]